MEHGTRYSAEGEQMSEVVAPKFSDYAVKRVAGRVAPEDYPLNQKQQNYKKLRLSGMSPFKAAKLAGYSEASARCGSPEKQVVMKAHLKKAFEEAGLTDEYIVAYAQAGMQCNKPINVDKDTKEITEYPDWQTRHKFFDTALELTGQKVEHKESGITNNIERLVIVRADNEVQVKEVSRPVCIQPCEVSGDGVGLGNRENDVPDFTSNVIQRADTEQPGNNIS